MTAIEKTTQTFELAQREARALAASSLVPDAYRDDVPNCLIAMEYATRIGASVLAVMQNLHVIKGKPSFSSSFLIGTVNASGEFTKLRFRMQGEENSDSWGCRAYAADKETGEECPGALVTIAMAKAEGWFSKAGSKWKTIPELMLQYRSAAFWTRVYCPELSLGIHTTDEMQDVVDAGPARVVSKTLNALTEELKEEETKPEEDDENPQVPQEYALNMAVMEFAKKIWGEKYKDKLESFVAATGTTGDDDKLLAMLEIEAGQK